MIPPAGGKARLLVQGGGLQSLPSPKSPAWSPDSQTIYYKAVDSEGRSSFWAIPVAGGEPRLLVRFDDPARRVSRQEFTTDGQRFFFTLREQESDVWVMELGGE
ncbi:MAG: PD40 domain-containing protein [Candidatus Latescibacteria bacterium]|nr:PD40 domain-containing protein [Candidatus Latescibacterota bacterium]